MSITVMDITYCGMFIHFTGMILLNIGYFFRNFLKPGLLISSFGFCVMMFAAGLSQVTGPYPGGSTHPPHVAQKPISPTS
jgi:hypothetical protein